MKQVFLEMFFEQVKTKPSHIAVTDPQNGSLTFKELADCSGKVFQYLKSRGIGKEAFVVICLPRSIYTVAAIIGVMRAGAAFTVAEAGIIPEQRLQYIIQDCSAKLVMNADCWKEIEQLALTEAFSGFAYCEPASHDAAYVIYTSGSTGQPKGCLHEYGGLEYMMKSADFEGKPPISGGIYALVIPMSMLATHASLFFTLAYGVTVDVVPLYLLRDPTALVEYFTKHHITSTSISPTLARILRGMKLDMEHIAIGSESANNVFIENCLLINYYASSECGCMACAFHIDHPYEETPIGKPQFDLQYRIIPLENDSEAGELQFYFPYFRGYLNLPEETARVLTDGWFHTGDIVRQLNDGNLLLLGRIDNMIKINGNRVEPEEVETAASRILGLQAAVAKGFGEGDHTYLCLYYVNATELDSHEASRILGEHLPYYMLPKHYIRLEQIPRLPSGKIDRNSLKPPVFAEKSTTTVAPRDELEAALCRTFAQVLGLPDFSAEDDFYLLGGDSIGTVEVIETCQIHGLNMYDMFNGRTPQKVAACYRKRIAEESQDIEAENQKALQSSHPLTELQKCALQYRALKPDSTLYDLYSLVKYSERMDMKRLEKAVETAFHAHSALLTLLHQEADGSWTQSYHPEIFEPVQTEYVSEAEFAEIQKQLIQPLQVFGGKLYRFRLFSTEKADYSFLQINHMISDGTSIKILLHDVMEAYSGKPVMTDCYYFMLQKQEQQMNSAFYQEAKEYYLNRYSQHQYDIRPHADGNGENLHNANFHFSLSLPLKKTANMNTLHKMGQNAVLATALALTVAVYNHSEHVMTAWAYHGRKSALYGNIVGMCYKNLPLALSLQQDTKLSELYADVRDQMVKAITYDCYAYNKINVQPIKGDKALLLYQSGIYDFDDVTGDISVIPQPLTDPYEANSGAFEIEVIMTSQELADCTIHYNSDMYRKESVLKFQNLFVQIVASMLNCAENKNFTFKMLQETLHEET